MATDIGIVLANLSAFFDFHGRTVVHVGAGGGQFIGYAAYARHVFAVDPDSQAIARLRAAVTAASLGDRVTLIEQPFEALTQQADVVFFEFCLHEIDNPDCALGHARRLATDVVVIDHAPESQWAWHVAETEKAERSWAAVERAGIRRDRRYLGWQRFRDVDELLEKVRPQGEVATSRALAHAGMTPIEISMTYRIALL
jgi:predicted RNA methylase